MLRETQRRKAAHEIRWATLGASDSSFGEFGSAAAPAIWMLAVSQVHVRHAAPERHISALDEFLYPHILHSARRDQGCR